MPARSASATAARMRSSARGYSERMNTTAWRAPTAKAESARPSSTPCGSRSSSTRSMNEPGSPSSPFATTNFSGPGAAAAARHLAAVGKPLPPRPRSPEPSTSASTASGPRARARSTTAQAPSARAFASGEKSPRAMRRVTIASGARHAMRGGAGKGARCPRSSSTRPGSTSTRTPPLGSSTTGERWQWPRQ